MLYSQYLCAWGNYSVNTRDTVRSYRTKMNPGRALPRIRDRDNKHFRLLMGPYLTQPNRPYQYPCPLPEKCPSPTIRKQERFKSQPHAHAPDAHTYKPHTRHDPHTSTCSGSTCTASRRRIALRTGSCGRRCGVGGVLEVVWWSFWATWVGLDGIGRLEEG
jgi:hypothetical protein